MKNILETFRMYLRPLTMEDEKNIRKIVSDPKTMSFYPNTKEMRDSLTWIHWQMDRYEKDGCGLWACILKDTEEFVGLCGVLYWEDIDGKEEFEIGYLFVRKFWNQGLATEAAMGCKKYAMKKLNRKRLISLIDPKNFASQSVAKKIGMRAEKETVLKGRKAIVFSMILK